MHLYIFTSLLVEQFITSSFAWPNLLINEFGDHLLTLYRFCTLESGRDTFSFLFAEKYCWWGSRGKHLSEGHIRWHFLSRRHVDEQMSVIENRMHSNSPLHPSRSFFLVSSFPIGSDDKISARVRSGLSLNEAVIEWCATVQYIEKSMCCVTRKNDSRRKSRTQ